MKSDHSDSAVMTFTTLPPSFLYVPGNRPERFAKACAVSGAVILDCEDAVPQQDKGAAQSAIVQFLADHRPDSQVWVRLDESMIGDNFISRMSEHRSFTGVMLAKADAHSSQKLVDAHPALPWIALVESAAALDQLDELAAHPSLVSFGVGEVDLLADLRIARTATTAAVIDTLRLRVVMAAAKHGLVAPIAPTSTDFTDLEAFAVSTAHLRDMGFRSRTAIHPTQCGVIVDALTPTLEETLAAKEVIALLEASGGGVAIDAKGRMIDAAVVRGARETLARASERDNES